MASDVQPVARIADNFSAQPFRIDFRSARLTDEQFEELCRRSRDLKFEMTAQGELVIVPLPAKSLQMIGFSQPPRRLSPCAVRSP